MRSPRRWFAVLVGLIAVGSVFGDPPPGGPPAPPPAGVPVEVETADGGTVRGRFTLPAVRLKASYGAADVDAGRLRLLELTPADDGTVTASATLIDKTQLTGQLLSDTLPVATDAGVRRLAPAAVRTVRFERPKDTSLLAAALGLVTLTLMEIVLGVDNIIFLAIIAGKLPVERQPKARRVGLLAALGTRLLLLLSLTWLLGLTRPLFTLPEMPLFETAEARGVSWRDLILLAGGVFLIGKSATEMHEKLTHPAGDHPAGAGAAAKKAVSFWKVIAQIAVVDIVFSLDSVVTAVGMVDEVWVMIAAMLAAVGVMMVAAGPIARFVDRRPTIKVLALSFLILIGVLLVAEGFGQHVDKGYIYFAMAFAVGVELVNLRMRKAAGGPALRELPPAAGEAAGPVKP